MNEKCRHCGVRKGTRPRVLCSKCYRRLDVRRRYPTSGSQFDPRSELSEAELDALVAEQMKKLPSWWDRDSREMARERRR